MELARSIKLVTAAAVFVVCLVAITLITQSLEAGNLPSVWKTYKDRSEEDSMLRKFDEDDSETGRPGPAGVTSGGENAQVASGTQEPAVYQVPAPPPSYTPSRRRFGLGKEPGACNSAISTE
jgi:hypothetical protein